jgi:cellulose synthase/poly-beta-1,6-N-acetylglucosamine synthase-like glycosyltransferase
MTAAETSVLLLYYAVLIALAVYSIHRFYLVRLRRRSPAPDRETAAVYPSLTVQLPVYNEPNVVERLLEAVALFEYPGELEIQVLDDSDDETSQIIETSMRAIRARGVNMTHLRRAARDGYKAGALAHGVESSSSELFAVFDADFVPPPDLLLRLVPYFADPGVGMVQARWTHLNRDESMLTRVQALFLDAHFAVESAARNFGGRFFNFNGTAGIWRRAAIEDAGGWSSSTLTEDLDLSYRAQMAGWRFVFLNDVEVPAELPAALSGFQDQQHRWAKGSVQTARKVLPSILASRCANSVKAEAVFHLTNNSAYLLSVVLALLTIPAMIVRYSNGLTWTFAIDFVLFAASSGSVLAFYREGQRWADRPFPRMRDLMAALPVGIGMSVRNAVAVVEGLVEEGGYFRRTPKRGDGPRKASRRPGAPAPLYHYAEVALAVFFLGSIGAFAARGHWASIPFLSLFACGYTTVAITHYTSAS